MVHRTVPPATQSGRSRPGIPNLSRIDEATYVTLTASLAASWLAKLDEAILTTKVSIAGLGFDPLLS